MADPDNRDYITSVEYINGTSRVKFFLLLINGPITILTATRY